ncbi:MAG: two-component system, NarL family, invasion response regulator UvrY [Caulobacteraceae bacterium]|nr:two-component system, NarL family, invasion response regulator UvrY [Caulobacteraceae bacterium]
MEVVNIAPSRGSRSIAALVDAIGAEGFEAEALRFINETTGAETFILYRLRGAQAELLGGASVHGPFGGLQAAAHQPSRSYCELHAAGAAASAAPGDVLVHARIEELEDGALRSAMRRLNIVDRVMVCGRRAGDIYALSLLRSADAGRFTAEQLRQLAEFSDVLIGVCAKQAALQWDQAKTVKGFSSVDLIEGELRRSDWSLTRRETQVAARLLFGISVLGVAIDLGLGEETVSTYRKRLYQRLQIGSRYELLKKYLALLGRPILQTKKNVPESGMPAALYPREDCLSAA